MHFEVLGTLRVRDERGDVQVAGPMRRRLLAALLCRAGRPARAHELIEDLWGEAPPRSATKTLQSHVVRLRDDLGRGRAELLITADYGYYLDPAATELDVDRFQTLLRDARAAADREPARAAALVREALQVWRDDAYADFGEAPFAVAERMRLNELRAAASDLHVDVELRCGRAATLIPELETRVAAEPYRERGWERLMLALYQCGRQADALAGYRRVRELLATELGVDPGDPLRELESRILRQDPALMADTAALVADAVDANVCPYRGLAGYTDRDAQLFVGRERLTAELAGLIAEHSLVVVTGPSGSGKSSLLQAGLLPDLRSGALPGSAAWRTSMCTPRDVLAVEAMDLLVVDQAEELFLDEARLAVAEHLRTLVDAGTRVVIAIRGDFVGRLAELPSLAGAARTTLLVRALRQDEVRRVITEPAARCGLVVEPDLVETVLDEISGAPAALPLLAVALVRAWQNRTSDTITLAGYRAGGGIAGALEATAEDVYAALSPGQATAARHVLPRLAVRQGTSWVRRSLARDAFTTAAELDAVAALVAGRLLSVSGERVELVHEALLTRWPRLFGWLTERELVADLLDHLATTSRAWQSTRADEDLYRGTRLQAARDWASEHDLSDLERDFLDASVAAADAELAEASARADREAAGRRRLRSLVGVLALVLLLAIAGGVVALVERSSARDQAHRADQAALTADARRLAASSLVAPDLRTSVLLAIAGYRLQDSADTRSALLRSVETSSGARWRITTANRLQWARADATGNSVWSFDNERQILRIDVARHRVADTFALRGGAADAVSPDGRLIAVAGSTGENGARGGQVVVQDAHDGTVRAVLPAFTVAGGFTNPFVGFTKDGRWLVAVEAGDRAGDRPSDRVAVFDAENLDAPSRTFTAGSPVSSLAAGTHDLALTTDDGDVDVVDAATLGVVHRGHRTDLSSFSIPDGGGPLIALSADDAHLALSRRDGTDALLLGTGNPGAAGLVVPLGESLATFAFSPSGSRLAVGTQGSDVVVLDTRSGAVAYRLSDSGPVHALDWSGSSDSTGLFSGGLDSELTDWDLSDTPRMLRAGGPTLRSGLAFRAGEQMVGLTGSENGSHLGLLTGRVPAGPFTDHSLHLPSDESVVQSAADASGDSVALTISNSSGTTWCDVLDAASGRRTAHLPLAPDPNAAQGCALSPDGHTLAVSVTRTRIVTYTVPGLHRSGRFTVRLAGANARRVLVVPLLYAPDGTLIVQGIDPGPAQPPAPAVGEAAPTVAPSDQLLLRADPATGRTTGQISLGAGGEPSTVDESPDHTRYAVPTEDGRVTLIDAHSFRILGRAMAVAGFALSASFSPDGSLLVASGTDGTMRFFDGHTLDPIGAPITGNDHDWWSAFYGGNEVVGLMPHGAGQQWFEFPGNPAAWARAGCALAGTTFTRAEWQQYVGDRPYQDLCPGS